MLAHHVAERAVISIADCLLWLQRSCTAKAYAPIWTLDAVELARTIPDAPSTHSPTGMLLLSLAFVTVLLNRSYHWSSHDDLISAWIEKGLQFR